MNALEQMTFDIDALLAEVNPEPPRPKYVGRAPLHFTQDYFTPGELAAAFHEWCEINGSFGSHPRSHMWVGFATGLAPDGHTLSTMHADIRCHGPAYDHPRGCSCPGDLLYRAQCDICHFVAVGRESDVIEAWHDHAWPGWRDLPVVPQDVRPRAGGFSKSEKAALAWATKNYPTEWQMPGAPVITERGTAGSRPAPGYSPWGGYDISATALAEPEEVSS
jgi:hypothetical protein